MNNPYEELVNAIVLSAVKDYRSAKRKLLRCPDSEIAKRTMRECERFFRSGWFVELTRLDGNVLIRKLEEE